MACWLVLSLLLVFIILRTLSPPGLHHPWDCIDSPVWNLTSAMHVHMQCAIGEGMHVIEQAQTKASLSGR